MGLYDNPSAGRFEAPVNTEVLEQQRTATTRFRWIKLTANAMALLALYEIKHLDGIWKVLGGLGAMLVSAAGYGVDRLAAEQRDAASEHRSITR